VTARKRGPLRGLLIDLTPIQTSADFRRLWFSSMITTWCRQTVIVAMPFQVFVVTHSSLWVGLLAMTQAFALVATGLYGGSLVDRFDRRRILVGSKAVAASASLLLTLSALSAHYLSVPLWTVFVLAAVGTAGWSLDQSARAATVPRLVSRHLLPSALSLVQMQNQAGAIAGPAIGGLLIASFGLPAAYGFDVLGFLPAAYLVATLRPQAPTGEQVSIGWRAPLEALRFVRGSKILLSIFAADLNATIFGMPTAVFPAIALSVLHIGPSGLGLLYSAPAAGALIASLASGWVRRAKRQGAIIIGAIAVWGLAITAFGLSGRLFWLGLAFLAIAGAGDMVSATFRSTILQLSVPDSMRGRISAFNTMVTSTGPRLGDLEAGTVAALVSPIFSVVSGGLLSVAGILVVAALSPTLRGYRDTHSLPAGTTGIDGGAEGAVGT